VYIIKTTLKPLFKNGDSTNINNYRPISMISNFAKILEKIIKFRLVEFLEKTLHIKKNCKWVTECISVTDKSVSVFLALRKKSNLRLAHNFGLSVIILFVQIGLNSKLENNKRKE